MDLLEKLTTPYDTKKYHYYLRGKNDLDHEYTVDLFQMGYVFTSRYMKGVKYLTKEQALTKMKELGLEV